MTTNFIYSDDLSGYTSGATCVIVPKSIRSKDELLDLLSRTLSFPGTFGSNWDALFDCLCDLSWIAEKRVVIAHENLPLLPRRELEAYLDVLNDAVTSWRERPGTHDLVVVLSKKALSDQKPD